MNDIQRLENVIDVQNFVGGQFVSPEGPEFKIESPYFGEVIGRSRESTEKDIVKALHSAEEAQVLWSQTPLKERCRIMFKLREILTRDIEGISHMVSLECGKTLDESRAGILKGIEVLEFATSLENLDQGGRMEVSRGVFCEYRRRPLGVVLNITPFNFPAMVPMWTLPIAITLGNSYVWKPSEKTPLTSLLIANAFQEAGLPTGVLSILQGKAETVQVLCKHPSVKAIGFVGSSLVAEKIYQMGTSAGKRVLALGGAKNHIVLLPDADATMTGQGICDSFTGCAGQRCMAASVVLAVGDCDSHIEKVVQRAQSKKLGENIGAIITKEQLTFLHEAIDRAEKSGAKILLDGRKVSSPHPYQNGYWMGPTILDQVPPDSEAATRELFGPILSIVRCQNISEAMKIENKNPYGNACSVFTSTGALAEKVLSRARAGMLGVNIGVPVPREPFSFGGIQDSKFGHGDITGPASLNFWTDLIKVTTKWESQSDATWMS